MFAEGGLRDTDLLAHMLAGWDLCDMILAQHLMKENAVIYMIYMIYMTYITFMIYMMICPMHDRFRPHWSRFMFFSTYCKKISQ